MELGRKKDDSPCLGIKRMNGAEDRMKSEEEEGNEGEIRAGALD